MHRCHDHKFDPISMNDYYALYGIFDSSRYAFPGSEQKQQVRAMLPLLPPEESVSRWRGFYARITALAKTIEKNLETPPKAVLRSLHDVDGDFEIQTQASGGSNGVLVPPWLYHGKIAVTTTAQARFGTFTPRQGGRGRTRGRRPLSDHSSTLSAAHSRDLQVIAREPRLSRGR